MWNIHLIIIRGKMALKLWSIPYDHAGTFLEALWNRAFARALEQRTSLSLAFWVMGLVYTPENCSGDFLRVWYLEVGKRAILGIYWPPWHFRNVCDIDRHDTCLVRECVGRLEELKTRLLGSALVMDRCWSARIIEESKNKKNTRHP